MSEKFAVWELKVPEEIKLPLYELKKAASESFKNERDSYKQKESDNYKQKLVFDLLEAVKNKDQNRFFYLLLKAINKPKEDFKELWEKLGIYYDILPEEAFINFTYSIIIGIMSTYGKSSGGVENESE